MFGNMYCELPRYGILITFVTGTTTETRRKLYVCPNTRREASILATLACHCDKDVEHTEVLGPSLS